jgi:quinolinate synthase
MSVELQFMAEISHSLGVESTVELPRSDHGVSAGSFRSHPAMKAALQDYAQSVVYRAAAYRNVKTFQDVCARSSRFQNCDE